MEKFIAIIWSASDPEASYDAEALIDHALLYRPNAVRCFEAPGITILKHGQIGCSDEWLPLPGGIGGLAGRAFHAVPGATTRPLDTRELDRDRLLSTGGEYLLRAVWGSYIAFVVDGIRGEIHVLRDPSGAVPCYVFRREKAFAFFTDPDDISAIAVDDGEIDWQFLAQRLANNRFTDQTTALRAVKEIRPGEIVTVASGATRSRQAWSVDRIAAESQHQDLMDAIKVVQDAVCQASVALARSFEGVALRLSGGFDSSVVLGAITRAGIPVQCITFSSEESRGDERAYARAAASFAGASLEEFERDPSKAGLSTAVMHAPRPKPRLWLAEQEVKSIEAAFARKHGIHTFFSGRGGDNVFCRVDPILPLIDMIQSRGPRPEFFRAVLRTASVKRCSAWAIAKEVLHGRRRARTLSAEREPSLLLSEKAKSLLPETLPLSSNQLLGKRFHATALADRLNYSDVVGDTDYVNPLVTQPVMEACLRLPTYLLEPDGVDRGLARRAFAEFVPPAVLTRRDKGSTAGYLTQVLFRERGFVNSFLEDGILAGEGMLDCDRLRDMLAPERLLTRPMNLVPLMTAVNIEAWIRSWSGPTEAGAARTNRALAT